MSYHVDIKRRFVQCFVLRLWRWREGCKGALSPTGRLGTACCPTQGPQGMVSANASQHTLEGMKISWVSFLGTSPFKDLLAMHKRLHALQQKKSHRCPIALDQPIPFLPMQKICRVFTQAKNEHGYTWKLYALIRRGKKKTRKRLKDSAKQPTSSDPQDFGVKMNRGFSGFILFCVILLCPIL